MLNMIWETDYPRIIRAAYAEGAGVETIDQLTQRLTKLVTAGVKCYRVETETGAIAGIAIVNDGGKVLHSYLRPHFRLKYGAEFIALFNTS